MRTFEVFYNNGNRKFFEAESMTELLQFLLAEVSIFIKSSLDNRFDFWTPRKRYTCAGIFYYTILLVICQEIFC